MRAQSSAALAAAEEDVPPGEPLADAGREDEPEVTEPAAKRSRPDKVKNRSKQQDNEKNKQKDEQNEKMGPQKDEPLYKQIDEQTDQNEKQNEKQTDQNEKQNEKQKDKQNEKQNEKQKDKQNEKQNEKQNGPGNKQNEKQKGKKNEPGNKQNEKQKDKDKQNEKQTGRTQNEPFDPVKIKEAYDSLKVPKRAVGDRWWSNFMGLAYLQLVDGVEPSSEPYVKDDDVYVKFPDGLEWKVPRLMPGDLKGEPRKRPLPEVPGVEEPKPKKQAKAKSQPKHRPVEDFLLPTVRAKFCFQGKHDPIVKVEAREDRHDSSSCWKQKFQIVIRCEMCAAAAMNISQTFCQLYEYLNLNPAELDYKECRDSLINMKNAGHKWADGPMDWQHLAGLCLKGFPPKCPG